MTTLPKHIDLLQPTITEADDVAGFNQPYEPIWLVYVTPLLGFLFTGVVLAHNYGRLGLPRRRLPAAIFAILASSAVFIGSIVLIGSFATVEDVKKYAGLIRIGRVVIGTLGCYLIARDQKRRYHIFSQSDLPKPSWKPLVAIGLAYFLLLPYFTRPIIGYVLESMQP